MINIKRLIGGFMEYKPTHEEIQIRAFEMHQRYPDHTPEQNWADAEEFIALEILIQGGRVNGD